MKLKIADDLSLPLDVVTQTIAVLAKRRAGKSYTMRRLVEQLVRAGQQVVLVDPKGDQWGLRSAANGKDPGLSIVILGGERGDVPLEAGAGEVVAKLVVEERVSALLDLSLFRKHEVATFMTGFMEALYRLKAREIYRTPMMLVIDEADAIAPQKPQKGEERMLGAAEDIVRRGGQRGIGCVLVSQRSAVLNKNVLTQAQILVVLRTIAPQDLAAMKAWIDVHGDEAQGNELMASLPALPVGDAWFWSPGWPTTDGIFKRVHVLPIETFDSGKSPDPTEKKRPEPKHLADVDLEALKRQMASTIEKAKADDPRELRKQIAGLKAELTRKQAEVTNKQQQTVASKQPMRVEVLTDADRQLLVSLDGRLSDTMDAIAERADLMLNSIAERAKAEIERAASGWLAETAKSREAFMKMVDGARFQKILSKLSTAGAAAPPPERPARAELRGGVPPTPRQHAVRPPASSNGHTPPAHQRILNGLAFLHGIGVAPADKTQLALLVGVSPTSGGYFNNLGSLRSSGLIDYPTGGTVALTAAGAAIASTDGVPTTTAELHAAIRAKLPPAKWRILEVLIANYPRAIDKDDLAASIDVSPTSGGYFNNLGSLRSLGLVDYPQPGTVAARPVLFLES